MRLSSLTISVGLLFIAGCGDEVQGSLRLLLSPPHQGRNPTQDPFALVDRVQTGLLDENGRFVELGDSAPTASFGPGLIGGSRRGAPFVLGLNNRGRPVAGGFGPLIELDKGVRRVLTIPFSQTDHGVASKIFLSERTLPDPFAGRAATLFVDSRHTESGSIDDQSDLTGIVTALWQADDLLLQIQVVDDQIEPAGDGGQIVDGDAVRLYLDQGVITVGADGSFDLPDGIDDPVVESTATGYRARVEILLDGFGKNMELPFDLRVYDKDADTAVAMATWCFDPRRQGQEPLPEDYGKLVLGVPIVHVLHEAGGQGSFPGRDGVVEIGGSWDDAALDLEVFVPDDEIKQSANADLSGSDRVEFWIDLANGPGSFAEPVRFLRVICSAGSSEIHAGGASPDQMATENFAFSGEVAASSQSDGYRVELNLPWSDMQLTAPAQRGWFLGLEIRVIDEDEGNTATTAWSDQQELNPDLWPELRLFSVE